jgi:hypothetical protein
VPDEKFLRKKTFLIFKTKLSRKMERNILLQTIRAVTTTSTIT